MLFAKIAQIEMKYNSENTSDASSVHLEGNFLFLLSFFVARNRHFWPMRNYFFLLVAKRSIVTLFYMFYQLFSKPSNNRLLFCNWLVIKDFYFLEQFFETVLWTNQ